MIIVLFSYEQLYIYFCLPGIYHMSSIALDPEMHKTDLYVHRV